MLSLAIEQMIERYPLIVVGEITNIGSKLFTKKLEEEDYEGNVINTQTRTVPNAELTIRIHKVLKDEIGLTSDTVVVYDRSNGIGTNFDGMKTEYGYQDVIDHKVDDKGIFFIFNDGDKLYPIIVNREWRIL